MTDPFQSFILQNRGPRKKPTPSPLPSKGHGERAHSKYSASGAERWFNCPGSVALSEGIEDKGNKWSEAGTRAHEILEALMRLEIGGNDGADVAEFGQVIHFNPALQFTRKEHEEMVRHAMNTMTFILKLAERLRLPMTQVMVETRMYLAFIHPEMFGTFDGAVLDFFGTLHVFDFKYGERHAVTPTKNLQMIFYGMALAHKYDWNFEKVRLWIDQPRVNGYDGPTFWEISIEELRAWVPIFEEKVLEVELNPETYNEGSWCYWCKAKKLCPLKREKKLGAAKNIFEQAPIDIEDMDTQEFK